MKYSLLFCLFLLSCRSNIDTEDYLAYQASANTDGIVSKGFPEGKITFDSALSYAGSDSFILYDVADCEIHLYLEADESGKVKRLYWVQYEAYLPSIIPAKYDYSGEPLRTQIGGKEFYDGTNFYNVPEDRAEWRDGSDIEHVFEILRKNGYSMELDVMRIRLVHLDESRRKELMIIYMEDMAVHGLDLNSFGENGRESEEWKEVSEALRKRALAGMKLDFGG